MFGSGPSKRKHPTGKQSGEFVFRSRERIKHTIARGIAHSVQTYGFQSHANTTSKIFHDIGVRCFVFYGGRIVANAWFFCVFTQTNIAQCRCAKGWRRQQRPKHEETTRRGRTQGTGKQWAQWGWEWEWQCATHQ